MTNPGQTPVQVYRAADAPPGALAGEAVAVLGYGHLGRTAALNLRDSGAKVRIGNRDDEYAEQARSEGFEVVPIAAAATGDVVYVLLPDEVIPTVFDTTIAPARIPAETAMRAEAIARHVAEKLDLVGVLAVEMFVTQAGDLLVNEIAPRPHNSGHWTIDACITSQFEQLVRAVCGLPLGSVEHHSDAVMKNLLGNDVEKWREALHDPLVKLHLYGKTEIQPGRKMGHVTRLIPHR